MMRFLPLIGLMAVTACGDMGSDPGPTVSRDTPVVIGDANWSARSVNGNRVDVGLFRADMSGGFIRGMGPCNELTGNYIGTGPSFLVETLVRTNNGPCDNQELETSMIAALLETERAEVSNGLLRLFGTDGNVLMVLEPYYDAI